MRGIGVVLLVVLASWTATAVKAEALDVQVMSFNIRYGTADDGENRWDKRQDLVFAVIRKADADFVGLQEALDFQMEQIKKHVPGYDYVGIGREGGGKGEYSAILYRSKRFKVDTSGTFWLSDTPQKASTHWGNSIIRICTWGRFIEKKSGKAIYIYNTHLDHQSQPSREKSVRLIMDRIVKRQHHDPFILTGDFNAGEDNPAILYLKGKSTGVDKSGEKEVKAEINPLPLVDTFRVLHAEEKKVGTFNEFKGITSDAKIDYIFVVPEIKVQAAQIVRTSQDNRYPSDHFPVTAGISFLSGAKDDDTKTK